MKESFLLMPVLALTLAAGSCPPKSVETVSGVASVVAETPLELAYVRLARLTAKVRKERLEGRLVPGTPRALVIRQHLLDAQASLAEGNTDSANRSMTAIEGEL
jgi:hypothetical protein